MEDRRDHRIPLTLFLLTLTIFSLSPTVWSEEQHPPPFDMDSTTVVYTTPDSAVVEASQQGAATPPKAVHKRRSNCYLEAVNTAGQINGVGQVSLPTPPDERPYWVMCDGENVGMVWRKITPRSAPVSRQAIVEHLREEIPMPEVRIRANPGNGLAGSESWFWIEGYSGSPILHSTDAFGTPVEVEAKVTRYEWAFGDGTQLVGSLGRPYPEKSDVRHVYERSSAGTSGYPVKVRFLFTVRYRTAGGAWSDVQGVERTASFDYVVGESQAVISR